MNKQEFLQLAEKLYDAMSGAAPQGTGDGRAPKYDTALPAGPGLVIYASECSLKELQYQKARADKPPTDPRWADANAKRSKALGYFIAYRQSNPDECWTGLRYSSTVTAAPPSDRPEKSQRMTSRRVGEDPEDPDEKRGYTSHPVTDTAGPGDMDDIPFSPVEDVP